jgi:hypothetical protein
MKINTISVEDLMRECHIDDEAEFRKILRRRSDLPQISTRKSVSRDDANIIVKKLTGQDICDLPPKK